MATQKTHFDSDVKAEKRKAEYFEGKRDEAVEKLTSATEVDRLAKNDSD